MLYRRFKQLNGHLLQKYSIQSEEQLDCEVSSALIVTSKTYVPKSYCELLDSEFRLSARRQRSELPKKRKNVLEVHAEVICVDNLSVAHLQKIHSLLEDVSGAINAGYGVQNIAEITSCFLHIVILSYIVVTDILGKATPWFHASKRHSITVLLSLPWAALSAFRIVSIVYSCEVVAQEANHTEQLVNKLLLLAPMADRGRSTGLHSFAQQLNDSGLKYSAAGLFPIDRSLLASCLAANVNYLVILVQFGM
ncbi:putative gustatory receptor 28b [Schistocerca serialis cubense]|uniref:putative gustatory receptor 28b n=1 Tax=Schistocerca serialis cubense TaxID=2023355 RepID=UPI00214EAC62|nr:putative gustatory receptor 28b [Schistocerca serialis cubense]